MPNVWLSPVSAYALALVMAACTGTEVPEVIITGGDRVSVREGQGFTLSAEVMNPERIVSTFWTQRAGPGIALGAATSLTIELTAPLVASETMLRFRIHAVDRAGQSFTDDIDVYVEPVDTPPTIDAGEDRGVIDGGRISLIATSSDADGLVVNVEWSQVEGQRVTLEPIGVGSVAFVAPEVQAATPLTFRATAVDNDGLEASDDVMITVRPSGRPPAFQGLSITQDPRHPGLVHLHMHHESFPSTRPARIDVTRYDESTDTFQPLSSPSRVTSDFPADPEGTTTIPWNAIADVGFREGGQAWLSIELATDEARGQSFLVRTPAFDALRQAVLAVDHYGVTYGPISDDDLAALHDFQLVIVHPFNANLDRQRIAQIQRGKSLVDKGDDIIVLCYISVGEDLRTATLNDAQLLADPRFVGDGSGPRVDPRGPNVENQPLPATDRIGFPSPGGGGFAPWYLDDNSVTNDPDNIGDGLPDRNPVSGAAFTNIGHPGWFEQLNAMTFEEGGHPGIAELLTTSTGRGLGCDGVFLDTIDTTAPNTYTDERSLIQNEFEWTAPGVADFLRRLRRTYPNAPILQNRGLFFFNPELEHFKYATGQYIDYLLFESYRLNSHRFEGYDEYLFQTINIL